LILQEYSKFVTNLKQLKSINSEILIKRFKEIKDVYDKNLEYSRKK